MQEIYEIIRSVPKRKRDPWQKVIVASLEGKGLRLTVKEVQSLAGDEAILHTAAQRATNDGMCG